MTESFGPDTPVSIVARESLVSAVAETVRRLRALRRKGVKSASRVHKFRVATRRASAAVRLFADQIDPGEADRARKALKRLRRAAGEVRTADVHLEMLRAGMGGRIDPESRPVRRLIRDTKKQRRADRKALRKALDGSKAKRLKRMPHSLDHAVRGDGTNLATMAAHWMDDALPRLVDAVDRASADRAEFHQARIEVKRFRYAMELLRPCYTPASSDAVLVWLADLQDRMGAVNDLDELVEVLAPEDGAERDAVADLLRTLRAEGNSAYATFAEWWRASGRAELSRVVRPMLKAAGTADPAPSTLGARSRGLRELVGAAGRSGSTPGEPRSS